MPELDRVLSSVRSLDGKTWHTATRQFHIPQPGPSALPGAATCPLVQPIRSARDPAHIYSAAATCSPLSARRPPPCLHAPRPGAPLQFSVLGKLPILAGRCSHSLSPTSPFSALGFHIAVRRQSYNLLSRNNNGYHSLSQNRVACAVTVPADSAAYVPSGPPSPPLSSGLP